MTLLEIVEQINASKKSSINSSFSYFEIMPNLKPDNWKSILNTLAYEEEPTSVVCYGMAVSKGLLSTFSKSFFIFTEKYLFIEGINGGMKYTDISKISYREEVKSGLFSQKTEGILSIKKSGKNEDIKGNIATKEIALFLDEIVQKAKNAENISDQKSNNTNIKNIVQVINENKAESLSFELAPKLSHRKLNEFIIDYATDMKKSSFAAIISENNIPILYFTNDTLYYKTPSSLIKFQYTELQKAIVLETKTIQDNITLRTTEKVILYNIKNEIIFEKISSKKLADIFNKIISLLTGKTIQTEIQSEIKELPSESNQEVGSSNSMIQTSNGSGLLKALGEVVNEAYDDAFGIKSETFITKGDEDSLNILLNKLDNLLQRENFFKNPEIMTSEKIYLLDETNVMKLETKESKLLLCRKNRKDHNIVINTDNYARYKYYFFAYFPNKNDSNTSLSLLFYVDYSKGNLDITFFSDKGGELDVTVETKITGVGKRVNKIYELEKYIGIERTMQLLRREDLFNRLSSFIDNMYELKYARDNEEWLEEEKLRKEQELKEKEEQERKQKEELLQKEKELQEKKNAALNALEDL